MKIQKGDQIIILAGKDKTRQGKVERVFPKNKTVLVPSLNQYIKHKKPQGDKQPGERLTLSRPFHVSKVALVCPKCQQTTRVGYKMISGSKIRVCRKCNTDLK